MLNKNHAQAGQNIFMSSVTGLANLLALIAAFFGGPILWKYTIVYVRTLTFQTYGDGLIGLASVTWYGLSFLLVFFVARASVGTALIFGGLAIITRFM
ncbi:MULTISPECIES: hypothetical protein [Actibacterium]|uniref:Uncharacterized protein n=1 Tax=Actibacterium naphthalenivorans TaxID=1614693 RepID=A0A840CGX5_9RHOB|nr:MULTISPECIES: hypothetical protein [Actibacterium]ALG91166.1 hypothetical protein TQ29_14430 [Actibacterium sp. EMB200-NS6]MBB4022519.1 hypothetical protein [Actibacterium naphthalenivorans]